MRAQTHLSVNERTTPAPSTTRDDESASDGRSSRSSRSDDDDDSNKASDGDESASGEAKAIDASSGATRELRLLTCVRARVALSPP